MATTDTTTRTELAEHVADAFDGGTLTRDDRMVAAAENHAPERVLAELRRLPEGPYRDLRQLWPELPGLPVG